MDKNNNIELTDTEQKDGFVVIATKVHPLAAVQLRHLCERVGIKPYKLLQHVIACLIKMMGEPSIMEDNSKLHEVIETFFSEIKDFATRYNIADPNSKTRVIENLMFLADQRHPDGIQSVLVTPQRQIGGIPFPTIENWNIIQQMEFVIQNLDPVLYKKLRRLNVELGSNSNYELLHRLANDALQQDTLLEEIRELFADNDRSDWGKKPAEQPYKRHPKREPKQEKIRFADEDKDLARLEAEGWKPFGAEW